LERVGGLEHVVIAAGSQAPEPVCAAATLHSVMGLLLHSNLWLQVTSCSLIAECSRRLMCTPPEQWLQVNAGCWSCSTPCAACKQLQVRSVHWAKHCSCSWWVEYSRQPPYASYRDLIATDHISSTVAKGNGNHHAVRRCSTAPAMQGA
jgi:hypothetical protein